MPKGRRYSWVYGALWNDPKEKTVNGKKLAEFSLAANDRVKKDRTHWHQVKCWDKLAEIAMKYLAKGSWCIVEGEISLEQYRNKEGEMKAYLQLNADTITFISTPKVPEEDDTPF